MTTNQLLTAVLALIAVSSGVVRSRGAEPAKAGPGITAEVRGTLRHETGGHIYSIAVPPDGEGGQETRVWLMRSEDKDRDLNRKLERLDGKQVVAKGRLAQMPKGSGHATVPPLDLYLGGRWSIEAARGK